MTVIEKIKSIKNTKKHSLNNHLATNIKSLLEHHNITISELSRQTSTPKTTLFSIINDNNPDPRIQTLKPIAEFFKVTIDELLSSNIQPGNKNNKKSLPIINWQDLNDYIINKNTQNQNFTIETTASHNSFILKTTKSMRPRFMDNTLLVFDPDKSAEDGDIVLINDLSDNSYTIKELYYDGTKAYLLSMNPNKIEKSEHNISNYNITAVLANSIFSY